MTHHKKLFIVISEGANVIDDHRFMGLTLTTDSFMDKQIRFFDWLEKYILAPIHCLPSHTELSGMESGWKKVFALDLCKELRSQLRKEGNLYKFRIVDIKEKWGKLVFDPAQASPEVYSIINKYVNKSKYICPICGKPATYVKWGWAPSDVGWKLPVCNEHLGELTEWDCPVNMYWDGGEDFLKIKEEKIEAHLKEQEQ